MLEDGDRSFGGDLTRTDANSRAGDRDSRPKLTMWFKAGLFSPATDELGLAGEPFASSLTVNCSIIAKSYRFLYINPSGRTFQLAS